MPLCTCCRPACLQCQHLQHPALMLLELVRVCGSSSSAWLCIRCAVLRPCALHPLLPASSLVVLGSHLTFLLLRRFLACCRPQVSIIMVAVYRGTPNTPAYFPLVGANSTSPRWRLTTS
jgi:hypothetical protein